jgi:hypothetical protein
VNAEIAAVLAAIGFGLLVLFQIGIALGAPLGPASWGGTHPGVLPPRMRVASAIAVVVWSFAGVVILGRAGLGPLSGGYLRPASWALVVMLFIGAVTNAASRSRWERFGWTPFTLALAAACAVVVASSSDDR